MKISAANYIVLFVIISGSSFGQVSPVNLQKVNNPVYPSPTAASLGKYSDIPVSYHTGVPSIGIPLYTITEGGLELSISLSYHSGGIRVDETASAVGLGWSLNAGGMISRSINGGPDEGLVHSKATTPRRGWGFYKDGGFPPEIITCEKQPSENNFGPDGCCWLLDKDCPSPSPVGSCLPCALWYQDAALGTIDLEPDLYSFNLGGYSGKFFFDEHRNIHMLQESGMFIKPLNELLSEWMIIAPDGVKYFFGGTGATEKSYADPGGLFTNFSDFIANTTWYLTKIESINGERWIKIEYEDEYYSFGNRKGQTIHLFNESGPSPNISDAELAVTYVQGKRLKKITTSSTIFEVTFIPSEEGRQDLNFATNDRYTNLTRSSEAKAISAIEIISPGLYKKFRLNQSYFTSASCTGCQVSSNYNAEQHKKRLRLDGVVESDKNNNAMPPYVFTYNSIPFLPSRYSLARDAQGYYNGYDANDGWFHHGSSIKNYSFVLNTGDYHQPQELYMKAGVLTKILYPLGRITNFEYESHSTGSKIIGGLRVKSIKDDDSDGHVLLRQFTYENPKIYFDDSPDALYVNENKVDPIIKINPDHVYQEYFANAPVVPLFSSQGYAIAYDKVTETKPGNGSTIYTYYSFPNEFPSNPKFPLLPLTYKAGSGELKTEKIINNDNEIVLSKEYAKDTASSHPVAARRVALASFLVPQPPTPPFDGWPYYQDYTIRSRLFRTSSEIITQQGVTTSTQYSYPEEKIMPSVIETRNSKGENEKILISYAGDEDIGAPSIMYKSTDSENKYDINYKHLIYEPVRITKEVNGKLTERSENFFTAEGTKIHLTKSRQYPTGSSEYLESLYSYDNLSNLINIKTNDGISKSLTWGHHSSYVVAEAINAEPEEIYYEGFEEKDTEVSSDAKTGLKSSTAALSIQLPAAGNYILSYWAKMKNGFWKYKEDPVSANTTIGGPDILIDEVRLRPEKARVTTRQFHPGLGVISETDANNNTVYYEYDSFGRLKLQRDTDKNLVKVLEYQIRQK